jgi:hypothetical protein
MESALLPSSRDPGKVPDSLAMSEPSAPWRTERIVGVCALVILLLVAGGLGVWAYTAEQQREAVADLTRNNFFNDFNFRVNAVSVQYGYELAPDSAFAAREPPGPKWLRDKLGIDYLATVRAAHVRQIDSDTIQSLAALKGLRGLELSGSGEAAAMVLQRLDNWPQLERLVFWNSFVTDGELAYLLPLERLRILELTDCNQLTDASLDAVVQISSLKTLTLRGDARLTNAGLAKLGRLKNLETLQFSFDGEMTDAGLEKLRGMPRLRHLFLDYTHTGLAGGLERLGEFPSLEKLDIWYLSDEAAAQLPTTKRLKELSLTFSRQLSAVGLKNLDKFPNLEKLYFSFIPGLDDAGMVHVASLAKLRELVVHGNQSRLTDASLESLGRMSSLRTLFLYGCTGLTDAGLAHLAGLKNLEQLTIGYDPHQFSTAARDAFGKALPGCRVHYGDAGPSP